MKIHTKSCILKLKGVSWVDNYVKYKNIFVKGEWRMGNENKKNENLKNTGTENSKGAIIHFFQKILDKTVIIRFTSEFILKIFELSYKKRNDFDTPESNQFIKLIQATLFAKINNYVQKTKIVPNNFIEIFFEEEHSVPAVTVHHNAMEENRLLHVFFKRTDWEEINEFRYFLGRYISFYLKSKFSNFLGDDNIIRQVISDITYIVQELLQNANEHSFKNTDYEFSLIHKDDSFYIMVGNYGEKSKLDNISRIINEVKQSDNLQELLMKYMLDDDKHLGLVTSIVNFKIDDINVAYDENNFIKVNTTINLPKYLIEE